MATSLRNSWDFKNLLFRGARFESNFGVSRVATGAIINKKIASPNLIELILPATGVTVTDNGGATGGFLALELFRFPNTRIAILSTYLELTIISTGAGISQTATLTIGLGTSATTDATINSGEVNVVAAVTQALTGGAAVKELASSTVLVQLDAMTNTSLYLNVGVPDASISADTAMSISAILRMVYLDLSGGR